MHNDQRIFFYKMRLNCKISWTVPLKYPFQLNSVSFARTLRSCGGISEFVQEMQEKPRFHTLSYLVVFVYYDKRAKKVWFDLPYGEKEIKNGPTLRPRKFQDLPEREKEDMNYWFNERKKMNGSNLSSELCFRVSNRERAFYNKMDFEELGKVLQLFTFETITMVGTISITNNDFRI